jgi:hypothetical protein
MDICNKAVSFFMEQKSIKAVMDHFIGEFMEVYEELRPKERELIAQCIYPLFRRYYYSALEPDTYVTYAALINAMIEKECGRDIMLYPVLKPVYRRKKIQRIDYDVACYRLGQHKFVKDMETFLGIALEGISVMELGILPQSEHERIKSKVVFDDRHYFNIIAMTAIHAGLVHKIQAEDGHFYAITSSGVADFLSLGNKDKLRFIANAILQHFSKIMLEDYPSVDVFHLDKADGLLKKSVDFDELFTSIEKKLNIAQDILSAIGSEDFLDLVPDLTKKDMEQISTIIDLLVGYDMFFLTPFANYLQLIQPIYAGSFIMEDMIDDLLCSEDIQEARTKLFLGIASYDLTPLGEALLGRGRRPKRRFALNEVLTDDEALEVIEYFQEGIFDGWNEDEFIDDETGLFNTIFKEADETDSAENDFEEGDNEDDTPYEQLSFLGSEGFKLSVDNSKQEPLNDQKNETSIDRKGNVVYLNADNRIYTFKVKLYRKRGSVKHIQLKGSDTLDDLHKAIFNTYDLEPGHLYSFFLSNKAWDSKTEYSHPKGSARSAAKAVLSRLALEPNKKFMYLYDYGDEIKFEIQVEET